jgi:hypothetical protein
MERLLPILIISSSILFTGCLSPKFQCETTKTVVCASPEKVYKAMYTRKIQKKSTKLDYATITPILKLDNPADYRTPERIYRIWVPTYVDRNGQLVGNHFIYVAVPGTWNFPKVSQEPKDDVNYDKLIKDFIEKERRKIR